MKTSVSFLLSVIALFFAAAMPALAFDVVDGKVTITIPAEKKVMDACMAGQDQCFIVNREVLHSYAEAYAQQKVAELIAEVSEKFDIAVEAKSNDMAKQICRNTI